MGEKVGEVQETEMGQPEWTETEGAVVVGAFRAYAMMEEEVVEGTSVVCKGIAETGAAMGKPGEEAVEEEVVVEEEAVEEEPVVEGLPQRRYPLISYFFRCIDEIVSSLDENLASIPKTVYILWHNSYYFHFYD